MHAWVKSQQGWGRRQQASPLQRHTYTHTPDKGHVIDTHALSCVCWLPSKSEALSTVTCCEAGHVQLHNNRLL